MSTLLQRASCLAAMAALAGCDWVVLNPAGDVAAQQGRLVVISTVLMLLIIVPVIVLTLVFAWRYRQSNTAARYEPDWDHSIQLELVIWAAPLLIIIALGALTWISTHTLDPYRPLARIAPGRPIAREPRRWTVEVVALDWKWLFIYPEHGIATVNELAAPVDRPMRFKITVVLGDELVLHSGARGQIYAMPGMETQAPRGDATSPASTRASPPTTAARASPTCASSSTAMSDADFERWVEAPKAGGNALDRDGYLQLEKPSEREPVRRYGAVDARPVRRHPQPLRRAGHDLHAAGDGDGRASARQAAPTPRARRAGPTPLAQVCTADDPAGPGPGAGLGPGVTADARRTSTSSTLLSAACRWEALPLHEPILLGDLRRRRARRRCARRRADPLPPVGYLWREWFTASTTRGSASCTSSSASSCCCAASPTRS